MNNELQWVKELLQTRDAGGQAANNLMKAAGWSPTAVAYVVLMDESQTARYKAGLHIS